MNSDQPPPPPERLRPTLQLKIKANSSNGFRPPPKIKANSSTGKLRPTLGMDSDPPERLRPTLQLKIKANSWNGFSPPPRKIKANSSTEN